MDLTLPQMNDRIAELKNRISTLLRSSNAHKLDYLVRAHEAIKELNQLFIFHEVESEVSRTIYLIFLRVLG